MFETLSIVPDQFFATVFHEQYIQHSQVTLNRHRLSLGGEVGNEPWHTFTSVHHLRQDNTLLVSNKWQVWFFQKLNLNKSWQRYWKNFLNVFPIKWRHFKNWYKTALLKILQSNFIEHFIEQIKPNRKTRNSCTGRSPVQSIGHARSCRRCVAAYLRADMAVTKMQISPVIVNGFENGFHRWIQRIFLVVVDVKKLVSDKIFLKSWIHFAAL